MTFRPSHYQQAIFDFVQSGTGDGVVRATAGSGKTTTLVEIARQLPADLNAVFLAFNAHTADELRKRLPRHVKAFTVHQLGRRSLMTRFPKLATREVHKQKSRQIIHQHIQQMKQEFILAKEVWPQTEKYLYELLHFSMTNLTNTRLEEEVAALALEYNLFPPQDRGLEVQCHREIRHLLRARLEALRRHCIYDYEDMLYMPVILNLDIPKYDFVFVDEAQDLSALQLEVVLRAVSEGGRRLFVGDERQAIYGFTGADSDSLGRIVSKTNATTLPLSVTYRCPRSHVLLAQKLAPEIEPAPNAIEGKVFVIKESWLPKWARRGDLILCRYTAPLVKQCLILLQHKIPAVVRGMDIAHNVLDIAHQLFAHGFAGWESILKAYRLSEAERIYNNAANDIDAERQLAIRNDLLDSLAVLTREVVRQGATHVQQLTEYINTFFSDKGGAPVVLSTIHKAKGREAERVFLLFPDNMPAVYARTATAARGEACVQFVALTRAKRELIFVEQEPDEEDWPIMVMP